MALKKKETKVVKSHQSGGWQSRTGKGEPREWFLATRVGPFNIEAALGKGNPEATRVVIGNVNRKLKKPSGK